ncbi:hypothetical protein GF376_01790 [Candidatus Peregrinibacteria bacterium]|nr:hypothetical protein [Candidatus Peregrinibacteria bacterium]
MKKSSICGRIIGLNLKKHNMDAGNNPNKLNTPHAHAEDQPVDVNKKILGTTTLLSKILAGIIVIVIIYTIVISFQKGTIAEQQAETANTITALNNQIENFEGDRVLASDDAREALNQIEETEIRWSEVIENINSLIPRDSNGARKIKILSYNGSSEGRISISGVTNAEVEAPFSDVSQVISIFNGNLYFQNVYIPSISKGIDENGRELLSFIMNLNYEAPDLSISDSENSSSQVPAANSNNNAPRVRTNN